MRINNRLFCSEKLGSKCTSVFLRLGIFAKVIFFACKKDTFLNVKHSPRRPLYKLTEWTQDISRNLINCKHHFRVLEQRFTIWTTYRPLKTSSDGTVTWYSFGFKMKLSCNPGSTKGSCDMPIENQCLTTKQPTFWNGYPFSRHLYQSRCTLYNPDAAAQDTQDCIGASFRVRMTAVLLLYLWQSADAKK